MLRILLSTIALVAVLAAPSVRSEETAVQREDQFKAAYLFNFVKFVEWPDATPTDTLIVCFVGGTGVYDAFSHDIEDKRVGTRRLIVRRVPDSRTTESCDALYMDAAAAAGSPPDPLQAMLTVSDAQHFAERGGMIELFTEEHRLRFLINIDSAQKAGLRISSDLLKLAAGVQRDEE